MGAASLTAHARTLIREARDRAVRARVAAELERQKTVCACPVCLGLVACGHGTSAAAKYGCRHPVSRAARATAKRRERREQKLRRAA